VGNNRRLGLDVPWVWGRSRWGIDTDWGRSLEPRFQAYATARQAFLNASESRNPVALAAAQEGLVQAEEAVRVELELAWDANIAAVQEAKAALTEAMREQARVEVEAGTAARARNPSYPLLNAEEFEACQAAAAASDAARQAIADAKATFKAGVTVEQLEAVA
jgi:hypothetical protein